MASTRKTETAANNLQHARAVDSSISDHVQSVVRAAISALSESKEAAQLFPNGIRSLKIKVRVGGTELYLKADSDNGLALEESETTSVTSARTPADVASEILKNAKIELLDSHASGNVDDATALDNITDTSKGKNAKRSSYGSAPGGTIALNIGMLEGLLGLATTYSIGVSEIAGGEHSPNSRHYVGVAFDAYKINGKKVDKNHPDFKNLMADAKAAGATEVLGPGDTGHDTHVHAAWPRPRALKGDTIEAYCEAPS
jgi:hypothetical protein